MMLPCFSALPMPVPACSLPGVWLAWWQVSNKDILSFLFLMFIGWPPTEKHGCLLPTCLQWSLLNAGMPCRQKAKRKPAQNPCQPFLPSFCVLATRRRTFIFQSQIIVGIAGLHQNEHKMSSFRDAWEANACLGTERNRWDR